MDESGFNNLKSRRVDSCIYCRSTTDLSDEHVIPRGLGGDLQLKGGSCEVCRLAIHPIETKALSGMLGPLRHGRGMQTRPRKDRKIPGDTVDVIFEDDVIKRMFVPADELPKFSWVAPRYLLAPYLLNEPTPEERQSPHARYIQTRYDRGDVERMAKSIGGLIVLKCDEDALCRMLAKIAHGFVTASLGFEDWTPFLVEYILRGVAPGPVENYIGHPFASSPIDERNLPESYNTVRVESIYSPGVGGKIFAIVNIYILPNIGNVMFPYRDRFPAYCVVAGEVKKEKYDAMR